MNLEEEILREIMFIKLKISKDREKTINELVEWLNGIYK